MKTNKNVLLIIFLLVSALSISQNVEKQYFDNGKIKSIGNKINGKRTGEWKYYQENGYKLY
jgi:antitoxin component YwqK of YwqJK toxin-antitoxin module